jgi:hypothetical protein
MWTGLNIMIPYQCQHVNPLGWGLDEHSQQATVASVVFRVSAVPLHSTAAQSGFASTLAVAEVPVPNRGIAECPNGARIYVEGVPRGRADTPGFDRSLNKDGQRVTEFGVPPLPRKNTQQEARIFGEGFLLFLGLLHRFYGVTAREWRVRGTGPRIPIIGPSRFCILSCTSLRCTGISLGASMPSRTLLPRIPTTVTTMFSSMQMLSFCFLLKTNMGHSFFLGHGSSVRTVRAKNKKADVAENPKVFGHVGLLFN